MSSLELIEVTKRYGAVGGVLPVTLAVPDGEFVVIMGPSGCGKSTLLRLIAGLEAPSGGRVLIGGRDVTRAAPARRDVGMVFQSYALYPHLTVAQNIAFPLRVARRPREEIAARTAQVADLLDLTAYLDRKPRALSGGQRQRVSIGRAIVRRPGILLLDEPLSNLDADLRARMRHEFARLHAEVGATMVYVTHDQLEAMTLANRIVVMEAGRVEQVGAPLDLYRRPDTLAVARAIGSPAINLLPVLVADGAGSEGACVRLPDGGLVRTAAHAGPPGTALTLGVRPEHLRPRADGPFRGRVELFERLGPASFAYLGERGRAGAVVAQLPGDRAVTLGDVLGFDIDPADALLFGSDGRRLDLNP